MSDDLLNTTKCWSTSHGEQLQTTDYRVKAPGDLNNYRVKAPGNLNYRVQAPENFNSVKHTPEGQSHTTIVNKFSGMRSQSWEVINKIIRSFMMHWKI